MELKDFKKLYSLLQKKYHLPSFAYLNENFEIDKIEKDTDCILRIVRKVMMEKIVNSMGFLELLLNPSNSPRMYLAYARSLPPEDKKIIEEIYNALGNDSLRSIDLEIDYTEKKEAEVIKAVAKTWESIKPKFRKILANIKIPTSTAVKKEKSYFG